MESIAFSAPLEARWRVAEEPATYGVRPTVYLDTTIPSYFTNPRHQEQEIARCQRITHAKRRLSLLKGIPKLTQSEQTERLATTLISSGILPLKASADAAHIAVAAAHSIQFLLTWNCKHLANPFIARHVVRMCALEGLRCPKICTPEVLMRAFRHEKFHH